MQTTSDRKSLITHFLSHCELGAIQQQPLKGDASFRRYERIRKDNQCWILMDAPPPQEDVRPFIRVTQLLRDSDLSAPEILNADPEKGFLLLEDLGDNLYSLLLSESPQRERELYLAAADVLLHLQQSVDTRQPNLPLYDEAALTRELSVFADWFLPQVLAADAAAKAKDEWLAIWHGLFTVHPLQCTVPVLRDFHADNLIWLPDRKGVQRVGLLDYQDALWGDPAYDVVSFLEDARRDVSPQTVEAVLSYYLEKSGQPRADFMRRYAMLGAQRNSKIIGIFTRLYVRDGKPNYLSLLPRVWRLLERDLQHPVLQPVRHWLDTHVPVSARGVLEADPSIRALA